MLYRLGITLLTDERTGGHASMRRAANNPNSPLWHVLGGDAETYFEWFDGWRNIRNGIKLGSPTSIAGPGGGDATAVDDWGLSKTTVLNDGGISIDCSEAARVSDVVIGIGYSTRMMKALTSLSRQRP